MQSAKKLKPKPDVARDFGVTTRSIDRWIKDESLGFPQPVKINTRCYFDADAREAWKAARLRGFVGEAA
jgi:predicted DNA-binding transcriptional regulator AlpA